MRRGLQRIGNWLRNAGHQAGLSEEITARAGMFANPCIGSFQIDVNILDPGQIRVTGNRA